MSFQITTLKWGPTVFGTPSGTITWAADLSGLDFGGVPEAAFEAQIDAAFDAWQNSASVEFEEIANFAAADIRLIAEPLSGDVVGQAFTRFFDFPTGPDTIFDSLISFDSSSREWSVDGSDPSEVSFFAVALHEIGHAIGLEHVTDPSEIMNPVVASNELGDGDVDGARVLYGADPGDVEGNANPPGVPASPPGNDGIDPVDDGGDDDDGGAVGLIALLVGALLALLGAVLGPAGAAVGMAMGLGRSDKSPDETGGDPVDTLPVAEIDPETGAEMAEALALLDSQAEDTPLSDLIPMLEDSGFAVESRVHRLNADGTCDGYCGGSCGDPEHLDDALTAIV